MSRNETEAKRRVMKKVWLRFSVWTVVVGSLILCPAPIMMADPPKDPPAKPNIGAVAVREPSKAKRELGRLVSPGAVLLQKNGGRAFGDRRSWG